MIKRVVIKTMKSGGLQHACFTGYWFDIEGFLGKLDYGLEMGGFCGLV
jgi:hypothetical protein